MQQLTTDTTARGIITESFGLSAQDVARLLSESTPSARIDVLEKLAAEHGARKLGEREQEIAQQIFRVLMRDTDLKVRLCLATALKEDPKIPRDIILHMVEDVEDVSLPVVQSSEVLSEADLVAIVQQSAAINRQIAVARRKYVPPLVSSALVETQKPEVVTELVGNAGAVINEASYGAIVDAYPKDKKIVSLLAERGTLPVTIAERLITHASEKVAEELRRKYKLGSEHPEQAREMETLKLVESKISPDEIGKLVEQMHASGRLTPSLVLTAVCRGNLEFFEMVMAQLAGVPLRNARMLVEDRGELGFKALYEKAKLPARLRNATRIVLAALLEIRQSSKGVHGKHLANMLVERVLKHGEGRGIENLSYILALIRQNNMH